jgi:hypothetical protein
MKKGIEEGTIFHDAVKKPGVTTYAEAMRELVRMTTPHETSTYWTEKIQGISIKETRAVKRYRIRLKKYLECFKRDTGSQMDIASRWLYIQKSMQPKFISDLLKAGRMERTLRLRVKTTT